MSKIFISHSTLDNESIVVPLNSYLKSKGHQVWYDVDSISISDSIPLEISRGIASSELYLLIISDNYNKSDWCKQELGAIIANWIGTSKRMVIIQIDNTPVEPIISHLLRLQTSTPELKNKTNRDSLFEKIEETISNISYIHPQFAGTYSSDKVSSFVDMILEANERQKFGVNLLSGDPNGDKEATRFMMTGQSEGLILVKPGGTFYRPCLMELFRRMCEQCEIVQLRLFNGELIEDRKLFERQYVSTTKLANGEIPLNEEDLKEIRIIYDRPEFEKEYEVFFSENLIVPALLLTRPPYNIDSEKISKHWEQDGRKEGIFWNKKWNGLNKIGYQKTVFPIEFGEITPNVRIVLNGFVPGYRALFVRPDSRTIAVHVATNLPWREIREKLVGGESNPKVCAKGSIRKDASDGIIPLNPQDNIVNGQRNVCHSSATLLDGMRELIIWFEYRPYQTILGRILELSGIPTKEISNITAKHLEDISWTTRDDTFAEILYEVSQGVVFDNLKGTDVKREEAIKRYARDAEVSTAFIRTSKDLMSLIENGLRLEIAGDEYYLFTIAKNLFDSDRQRSEFYEVAREIKHIISRKPDQFSLEVLAEAYRIAASDLCFLTHSLYQDKINSPQLFSSLVLAELPDQAVACAQRTQKNLIKDIVALYRVASSTSSPKMIEQTQEWKEFISNLQTTEEKANDLTAGLILAGGRSTRMSSSIPKAILPFGRELMLHAVLNNMKAATNQGITFYAAIGFRSKLIRRVLGKDVKYLEYEKTLGLAFRTAACLETLKQQCNEDELIILTYTDVPLISSKSIRELKDKVNNKKTFGLLTSYAEPLSGHIEERDGQITRIIQKRLNPNQCSPGMKRDVGLYIFYNTEELRSALRSVKNDNIRQEFIFADIVKILADKGWKIASAEENPMNSLSINTTIDLLSLVSQSYVQNKDISGLRDFLLQNYGLELSEQMHLDTFRATVDSHFGPFYFFSWWERTWLSKQ